jgi:hypothetical protein
MRRYFLLFPLFITACSGNDVKDTLGLSKDAPDEYRVVTRPPLSVPPAFELQPPAKPGEISTINTTDKQAKSLLTGKPVEESNVFKLKSENAPTPVKKSAVPAAKTTPEANFLQKAGAAQADPNVRAAIERDKIAARPAEEDGEERSWWNPRGWFDAEPKDPQVAAQEEAERLKKNKAEGKPVTEGETPSTSSGKDTGVLGKILGY